MITYTSLRSDRREFLALTGLTLQEFQLLLNAFTAAYDRRYPKDRTLADRPRQRCAGGGRKGVLSSPEQKRLFACSQISNARPSAMSSISVDEDPSFGHDSHSLVNQTTVPKRLRHFCHKSNSRLTP